MKIKRTGTPTEDVYFVDEAGPEPTDVVEIFETPLEGCYNWDYRVDETKVKMLYELGKKLNWNGSIDLPWDTPAPDWNFDDEHGQWKNHKDYMNLTAEQQFQFHNDNNLWTLCQFLHGEQGALLVASQLCSCAPTYNAKLYASSQTFDEARHVEVFNRYIQERYARHVPVGPDLKLLLDSILSDPRWDLKFIGMQVLIEGLALAAFQTAKENTQDPLLKELLEYVIRDEARHVTFGITYLADFVTTLTDEERVEREDFALHATNIMRNRFNAYPLWERYGFDVDYTLDYARNELFRTQFQDLLFTRVMPNLKKIGLLPERLHEAYESLGVLKYADGQSDYETSWEELNKPLQ